MQIDSDVLWALPDGRFGGMKTIQDTNNRFVDCLIWIWKQEVSNGIEIRTSAFDAKNGLYVTDLFL